FLLKMKMGYPDPSEEMEVLTRAQLMHPIEELEAVISLEEVRALQQEVKQVYVDDTIKRYIVDLANKTRNHPNVYLGASPRGSIALMKAAQAYAFINAREYVLPDDVQYLAPFVFSHRIILKSEAKYDGISTEELVQNILTKIPVPVQRLVK
ncbi:AAA family ATPase, partial [Peribacillus acanthi]|uniref:AAA family ATPase n=1 Tax=Peribacillus acanthi TaxID=2171554 RepID=UPI001F0BCE3F